VQHEILATRRDEHDRSGWNGMWLDSAFRSFNIEHLLPAISIPVLAIQGVGDEYGTLKQLDVLEQLCSGPVERLVLEACGHSPHRDRRDETLQAMRDFIMNEMAGPGVSDIT